MRRALYAGLAALALCGAVATVATGVSGCRASAEVGDEDRDRD